MKPMIRKYAILAINIALFVVLDRFLSIEVGPMKFTVSAFPIIIIALAYGPIEGLIVGFSGAFIGQMLKYGFTPTTILWLLPSMFRGLYVGFFHKKFNLIENKPFCFFIIITSSIVVTFINTIALYIDSKMFHYYSYALIVDALGYRILAGVITAVVYASVTPVVVKALRNAKLIVNSK